MEAQRRIALVDTPPPAFQSNPNGPTLPSPAAPVQHQPKPRCTVLR